MKTVPEPGAIRLFRRANFESDMHSLGKFSQRGNIRITETIKPLAKALRP